VREGKVPPYGNCCTFQVVIFFAGVPQENLGSRILVVREGEVPAYGVHTDHQTELINILNIGMNRYHATELITTLSIGINRYTM
jgi:hypothetical protein